jgi:hypothetical protein
VINQKGSKVVNVNRHNNTKEMFVLQNGFRHNTILFNSSSGTLGKGGKDLDMRVRQLVPSTFPS